LEIWSQRGVKIDDSFIILFVTHKIDIGYWSNVSKLTSFVGVYDNGDISKLGKGYFTLLILYQPIL